MSYGDSPEMLDYIDHLEAENERLREANAHPTEQPNMEAYGLLYI